MKMENNDQLNANNADAFRLALNSAIASKALGRSDRLRRMLNYIVEEELSGRGAQLKGYTIATLALGRSDNFDGSSDAIVRVEMGRLRVALQLHAASEPDLPFHIVIPKGAYRPELIARHAELVEKSAIEPHRDNVNAEQAIARKAPSSAWISLGIAAAIIALIAVIVIPFMNVKNASVEKRDQYLAPLVLVAPLANSVKDEKIQAILPALQNQFVSELSNYHWLSTGYSSGNSASSNNLNFEGRNVYVVNIHLNRHGNQILIHTSLEDKKTSEIKWRHTDLQPFEDTKVFQSLAQTTRELAAGLGASIGIIARMEVQDQRIEANDILKCLINYKHYMMTWNKMERDKFMVCADALRARPEKLESPHATGLALRALYDHVRWIGDYDRVPRMLQLLRQLEQAYARWPADALIQSTLVRVAVCVGEEKRISALVDQMEMERPIDPSALLDRAFINAFERGKIDLAIAQAEEARRIAIEPQPMDGVSHALKDFMAGDMASVRERLNRSDHNRFPTKILMQLIANAQDNDFHWFEKAHQNLAYAGFASASSIKQIVTGSCWRPEIKSAFLKGTLRAIAFANQRGLLTE